MLYLEDPAMKNGILAFLGPSLDGDSWEDICNNCYRERYKDNHYTEIPAVHGGDGGIEGFTNNGVVTQCYCPEREYTDNELYNHLRDKMSKDIKKLTEDDYRKRLQKMGVPPIKEWHFLIPEYRDSRIIEHAETKRIELMRQKKAAPDKFSHISDDFRIYIKTAEDYRIEITRLIRTNISDRKLNLDILHAKETNWTSCDTEKVQNVKRKVKAIMGSVNEENQQEFDRLVEMYMTAYVKGIEVMGALRVSYAEIYEDIHTLEQAYKRKITMKTMMNTDSSINRKLFMDTIEEFEEKIRRDMKYLTEASISELSIDLISGWLADCTMKFKG